MMFLLRSTKLRKKLLAYAFSHIDDTYYVRELASLINGDPGNLSRELKALEEEGLFSSKVRGKIKLFTLQKTYPLFNDLKAFMSKTEGVEGSLRSLISEIKGIELAFIYGSYAKNKEHRLSDIDLVAVGNFSERELTLRVHLLEKKLNREINFTTYSSEEFINEIKKPGGFLNLVLKEKTILLKGSINDYHTI
ncbi:MAG: nucleotidyltransferase domain-containing protein [Endomicrobiales bacterium]|nr:nucleotidyltransferase domain-containing protein [Endomicrobiales bacterium]